MGAGSGYLYHRHRERELEWHALHARWDQKLEIDPNGSYERQPYLVDRTGREWQLPLDSSRYRLDTSEVVWFRLEPSGQMRYFDEDREEVRPVISKL